MMCCRPSGSNREDLGAPDASSAGTTNLTEAAFRAAFSNRLGGDAAALDVLCDLCRGEARLRPRDDDTTADDDAWETYSAWYWALVNAGADDAMACPARDAAAFATALNGGEPAYRFEFEHVPAGPAGAFPELSHHG